MKEETFQETEKAIIMELFRYSGSNTRNSLKNIYFPKSLCNISNAGGIIFVTIPAWLFKKNNIQFSEFNNNVGKSYNFENIIEE